MLFLFCYMVSKKIIRHRVERGNHSDEPATKEVCHLKRKRTRNNNFNCRYIVLFSLIAVISDRLQILSVLLLEISLSS